MAFKNLFQPEFPLSEEVFFTLLVFLFFASVFIYKPFLHNHYIRFIFTKMIIEERKVFSLKSDVFKEKTIIFPKKSWYLNQNFNSNRNKHNGRHKADNN